MENWIGVGVWIVMGGLIGLAGGPVGAVVGALAGAGEAARGATAYVTLEPCVMCAGALLQARIDRLFFGAPDPKGGYRRLAPELLRNPEANHRCRVTGGILESACSELLTRFFRKLRVKDGKP